MDEKHKKRRTSILKKRPSTEDEPTEITVSKFPKRNQIQFSQKKQVKEFTQCEENVTIWGNTYETSVAKSEGSSDGSSTSRKISVDFSHTTINVTNHEAASMNESEKENLMVQKSPPRKSDEARSSLNNLSSASNSGCSIELTTVDMNADERKRVNNYGTDNLNITNMPLDNSYFKNKHLNVPGKNNDKILSPRKMIYLHKSSNLSVIIKDKVLMSPSEMDDNVSVSIEDDEKQENIKANGAYRKTITKPVDMNISIENKPPAVEKPLSKIVPTVFKFPEVPKTFNFQPQIYDSPPIKPAALENQKEEIDELFEMMISDTPSKNLCCIGKTHTPMKSTQKVLFSTSRPTSLRNSTDIFREIGLIDDDADMKLKSVRKTIFHNDSMKVDATLKDVNRKTIFDKIKMDETINAKNKTQNNADLDISIEPEKKVDPVPSKYEVFTDKMEETCTEKLNEKSTVQKSFFDLDDDVSCSVARSVPLMKLKSIDYGSVEKSLKRSTMSNDTCNATNFIMELTNIDDTGGSLETTAEIQRKATKLLKNPHATLGSSSTINSPFPEDISEPIIKELSKVHKSLNLEPDKTLEKSSTSYKKRMTTFDENKMEISGIEPTFEDPKVYATNFSMQRKSNLEMSQKNASKVHEEPAKSRVTTYNADTMDVTNVGTTKQITLKQPVNNRVTTYNADTMDVTNVGTTSQLPLKQTVNSRTTIYDWSIMEITTTSQLQANKTVNKRVTTYNADQMDTTRMDAPKNPDEKLGNFQNSSTSYKNRMTTFDENKMEISSIEPTFEDPKVYAIDLSIQRKTNMEMSQKNASKVHEDLVIQPTKSRVTSYNIDQMDISRAEATVNMLEHKNTTNLRVSKQYEIHVSPKELAKAKRADRSDVNHSNYLELPKSRATTYNVNKMDISGSEAKNPADSSAPKIQIYNDDIEQNMSMEVKESPLHKKRATIHNRNDMDVSALLIDQKRTTNYLVNNRDVTGTASSSGFCEQSPSAEIQRKATTLLENPHATLGSLITNNSPFPEETSETMIKERSKVHKSLNLEPDKTLEKSSTSYKNRMTTFDVNKMEISGIEPTFEDPKVYASNFSMQRKSNMEMSKVHIDPVIQPAKNRITTYNVDQMDVTNVGTQSQIPLKQPVTSRVTTYNTDQMDISNAEATVNMPEHKNTANLRVSKQYEIHVSPKELAKAKRADRSDVNHSNYLEVPKSRATTYNVNKMDISGNEAKNPADSSAPKIQIYNDDIEQNMSMEVKESPLHKKQRATTHNRNDMDVSALLIDQKRTTNYLVNNMDVSVTAGSSGFCEQSLSVQQPELESNDRRKTFTLTNKRESMKWHNITDTDLLNMIDNESNPCIQDISTSIPVSSEASNVSRYEEAMEDFMNLTVKASPLNQSVPFDVKMRQRRESRVLSPVRDYNSMFDNLIQDLKQKDRPKPRLEIDEYLEKLKIEPVKIPYYPQNQEGYLLNKIKELRQKHNDDAEKEERLKKEIEATQFPQIPSAKFLIKNYIECMEIEILKEVEKRRPVIAPVFPEAIDFEELLNNKFRTDEHLSKYWNLDTLFLYKGRFKLTHRMMNMFTLNIKCQQYLTEADESTIPIIFKDVMLYLGPDFRKPWSKTLKNSLSRRQFHRAINGVDNFTSICSSSNHLFTFLDYYHTNVMKANEAVNNLFAIVNKYKAVYKVHHVYKHEMVRKRCFLSDDTVDIEISVDGYIEDISIKNLLIDGNDFTYTLEPHANIIETKGLMLVELVLFDTEKFLQNNTSRVKIEED